ncbi:sodium/calcium exchanger regulatory protein 1 [Aplysia californica]|uniref:Sodium/calcium exchanger regulatory protein 1 n=1 Tax=Aplysia californica TaxID=6500 RepID=A0ABM1A7U0_APLCA|nr:sodium/calcium exchanger regulatory protein 1 [Aplysia californica]
MSVEEFAPGKWDLDTTDKFDDYMKALGVGMATRMIANKLKPRQEISVTDGEWNIKTSSTFKTSEVKFRIGEEFQETTADGRTVKTTVSVDGTKLIQDQQAEVPSKIVREFTKDGFTMTLTAKDVVCTRTYKRAP